MFILTLIKTLYEHRAESLQLFIIFLGKKVTSRCFIYTSHFPADLTSRLPQRAGRTDRRTVRRMDAGAPSCRCSIVKAALLPSCWLQLYYPLRLSQGLPCSCRFDQPGPKRHRLDLYIKAQRAGRSGTSGRVCLPAGCCG